MMIIDKNKEATETCSVDLKQMTLKVE